MEPPQVVELIICILAIFELFLVASYEGTFAVLSRTALEKMHENGIHRAGLMLRIHEPRHRLHLAARIGQALGTIALCLALYRFVQPFALPSLYAILIAAAGSIGFFLLTSTPRRLRFDTEGEEIHIPALALAFVPLHRLFVPLANLIERLASSDSPEETKAEKEEEFRSIVEAESETGVLDEGEKEMIEGVFGFHDRIVREVMVPRVDIAAVEQSATLADLMQTIKETGHSRVPLYEETLDRIRGIVNTKDLLQYLFTHRETDWSTPLDQLIAASSAQKESPSLLRDAFYVFESKKIDVLLRELRAARTRLAIVVDEYGGTSGLVTTEDLVEEIVGDLQDEYDDEEELFHWIEEGDILRVNPRINIDDLNQILETDLPNEGFETLAGFIFDHLGHVPSAGQNFTVQNLEITILQVEEHRIAQVQIKRIPLNGRDEREKGPNGTIEGT